MTGLKTIAHVVQENKNNSHLVQRKLMKVFREWNFSGSLGTLT